MSDKNPPNHLLSKKFYIAGAVTSALLTLIYSEEDPVIVLAAIDALKWITCFFLSAEGLVKAARAIKGIF